METATIQGLLGALRVTADPDRQEVLLDQLTEADDALGMFVRLSIRQETERLPHELEQAWKSARARCGRSLGRLLGPLAPAMSLDAALLVRGAVVAAHLRMPDRQTSRAIAEDPRCRWGLERLRWVTTSHLDLLSAPHLRRLVGLGTAILDHPRLGPIRTEWGTAIDADRARRLSRSMSRYPWPGLQVADATGRLGDVLAGLMRLRPELSHLVVESPVIQEPVWADMLPSEPLNRLTARIPLGAMDTWLAVAEDLGVQRIDLLHGRACAVGLRIPSENTPSGRGGWAVTLRADRADYLAPFGVRVLGTLVGVFAPHAVRVVLPDGLTEDEERVLVRRFRGADLVVDAVGGSRPALSSGEDASGEVD